MGDERTDTTMPPRWAALEQARGACAALATLCIEDARALVESPAAGCPAALWRNSTMTDTEQEAKMNHMLDEHRANRVAWETGETMAPP
jgi:hypothetical protein